MRSNMMKRTMSSERLQASSSASKLQSCASGRPGRSLAMSTAAQLSAIIARRRAGAASLHQSFMCIGQHLSRSSSRVLNLIPGAAAAAAADAATWGQSQPDSDLEVELDWRPELTRVQEAMGMAMAAMLCLLLWVLTRPATFYLPYAIGIGGVFGAVALLLRTFMLEDLYKAKARLEVELGDTDSQFRTIENIKVHIKAKAGKGLGTKQNTAAAAAGHAGPAAKPVAIHCYHGFGSNTWSWSRVQQRMADKLGALVTAHDMPGFGLTQRPKDLSGYFLAFNGRLGRLIMDYELAARGLLQQGTLDKEGRETYPHASIHEASSQQQQQQQQQQEVVAGLPSPSQAARESAAAGLEPQAADRPADSQTSAIAQGTKAALADAANAVKEAVSSKDGDKAAAPASDGGSHGRDGSIGKGAKRVLVGHSLGGACAALETILRPNEVDALVLVAPAIVAFGSGPAGVSLEELQDGSAFTRAHEADAGEGAESAEEQAGWGAGSVSDGGSSDSISRSSSGHSSGSSNGSGADLAALADASGLSRWESAPQRMGAWSAASDNSSDRPDTSSSGRIDQSSSGSSGKSSSGSTDGGDAADAVLKVREVAAKAVTPGPADAAEAEAAAPPRSDTVRVGGCDVAFFVAKGQPQFDDGQGKRSLLGAVAGLVQGVAMAGVLCGLQLLRPVVLQLLRAVVRSKAFWQKSLAQAYYDPSKLSASAVDAYRLPKLVRGWDDGMVRFVMARLSSANGLVDTLRLAAAGTPLEDAKLALRLAEVVAKHDVPVLIVAGQNDKLLPASNAVRLARMLKGSRLAVIKRCGHVPQEECPEAFAAIVCSYLQAIGLAGMNSKGSTDGTA